MTQINNRGGVSFQIHPHRYQLLKFLQIGHEMNGPLTRPSLDSLSNPSSILMPDALQFMEENDSQLKMILKTDWSL